MDDIHGCGKRNETLYQFIYNSEFRRAKVRVRVRVKAMAWAGAKVMKPWLR